VVIFVEPRSPRAGDLEMFSFLECLPDARKSNDSVCITKDVDHSVPKEIEDIIDPDGTLEVRLIEVENFLVDILPLPCFFINVEGVSELGAVDPLEQILPVLL
jgi:hypothetical protein